jgi:hypothetical protein
MPLCPPEIPYRLSWDWAWACALRCHWVTAWVMASPSLELSHRYSNWSKSKLDLMVWHMQKQRDWKGSASSSPSTQQMVRSKHGRPYINHPIHYRPHIKFIYRKKGRSSGSSAGKVTETEYKWQGTSLFTYNFVCKMTSFSFQNFSVGRSRLKACFRPERSTSVTVRQRLLLEWCYFAPRTVVAWECIKTISHSYNVTIYGPPYSVLQTEVIQWTLNETRSLFSMISCSSSLLSSSSFDVYLPLLPFSSYALLIPYFFLIIFSLISYILLLMPLF